MPFKSRLISFLISSTPRNIFISLFIRAKRSLILGATLFNFLINFFKTLPRHLDTGAKSWPRLKFFLKHRRTRNFFFSYLLSLPKSSIFILFKGFSPMVINLLQSLATLGPFRHFFFRPATRFGTPSVGGRASVKKKIRKKFFIK